MKLFLAFLCLLGTAWAELTPKSIPDCIHALNAAYGYTPPEVKFSISPGATSLKVSPSLSTYSENNKLQYASVGSSSSSYESTAGIAGYSHGGGPVQVTKYVAPVKAASYEPAVTYAKGGSITYADKSPASKFAAVVPSGIEFKNLVTPAISTKKISNAYLPPPVVTSKVESYQGPGYTYSHSTPGVSKSATYTSAGSLSFEKLGGVDLSKIGFSSPSVTTKIESFTSPGYTFSKQSPGYAKVETYTTGGYTKSGNLESIFSSGAGHPFTSSISYAPKISYGPPTVTKLATLTSQNKYDSFSAEPLFPKALTSGPTPAIYAPTVSKGYLPSIESSGYSKYFHGGIVQQFASKPAFTTQYVSAPAKVATYAAPLASQYISSPVKVATYSSGSGHLNAPAQAAYVAPVVAKAAAKLASYSEGSSRYAASGGGGGAISHQYVSKPTGHITGYAAPAIAKVATYSAPSVTHISSTGGALSHQYVSKPATHITGGYVAPAVAKVAYTAPAVAKVATYSKPSSTHFSSTGGAVSHQYVSRPATHITAGYAAPAVAKVAYAAPAIAKVATYSEPSSTHFSSTGGAVSHQYVSKPATHITAGYVAPAVAKVAYVAPAVAKVATYSEPSSSHFSSTGGALSHQYVSKPATHITTGYAAPAVAKVAYAAPAVAKVATYSSGSGAVSHQYVSKPTAHITGYAAPAVAKVATFSAPAAVKVASYSGESSSHFSSSGGSGGAISHQYISKPTAHITGYAAPAVAKIATYSEPAAVGKVVSYGGESSAHFSSSGSSGGAISHQYVSKPTAHITGYVAPAVAKVVSYAQPAIAKVATYSGASSSHYSSSGGGSGSISHQYVAKPAVVAAAVPTYETPAIVKVGSGGSAHYSSAGGAVSHQYVSKPAVIAAAPAVAKLATYETSGGGSVSHQYVSKPAAHITAYAAPAVAKIATLTSPAVSQYVSAPAIVSTASKGGAISHQYVSRPTTHITGYAAPAVAKVATYATAPAVAKVATYVEPTATKYASSGGGGAVSHQYVSQPSVHLGGYSVPSVAKVATYSAPVITKVAAAPVVAKVATYSGESGAHFSSSGAVSHQYVSKPAPAIATYSGPAVTHYAAAPAVAKIATYAAPAVTHYATQPAVAKVATYQAGGGAVSHQYVSKPQTVGAIISAPAVAKVATYAAPAVTHYSSGPAIGGKLTLTGGVHSSGAISHQYVSKPTHVGAGYAQYAQYATGPASHPYGALHTPNVNPLFTSSSITRYGSSGAVTQQYVAKPVQLAGPALGQVTHGAVSHQYVSKPAVSASIGTFGYGTKLASIGAVQGHQYVSQPLHTVHLGAPAAVHGGGYAKIQTSSLHTSSGQLGGGGGGGGGAISHQYVSNPLHGVAIAKPATLTAPIVVDSSAHLSSGSGKYSSVSSGYVTGSTGGGSISHQYVSQPGLIKGGSLTAGHLVAKPLAAPALQITTGHGGQGGHGGVQGGYGGHGSFYTTGGGAISQQHVSKQGLGLLNLHGHGLGASQHGYTAGSYYGAIALGHGGTSPALGVHDVLGPSGAGGHGLKGVALGQTTSIHGNLAYGSSSHGSLSHASLSHGSLAKAGLAHGSVAHGGLAHGSVAHGGLSLGSVSHGGLALGGLAHGGLAHGGLAHGGLAHGGLVHGGLAHLSPLSGYDHGVGGIGPLGAGFYRYAPAVPAISSHALSPTAYLKTAPIIQPAKIKLMTEKHLEHFNDHARYAFEYGVNDPTTGDIKHQREERDGDVVRGEYSLVEPDGNVRTVKYYADWETGFHAEVINSRDSVKTLTKRNASKKS